MRFYEIGQKLLSCRNFTAEECDHARMVVAKQLPGAAAVRDRFYAAGGNEAEWRYIEECLQGPSWTHYVVRAESNREFRDDFRAFVGDPANIEKLAGWLKKKQGE